jgi:hypothetical protein
VSAAVAKLRRASIATAELAPWRAYTEEDGEPLALGPGEALVIAAGARYVVEVTEPVEVFWTMTSQDGPIEFLD